MERMPQPRLRRGMTMKRQNPTAPAVRDDTLYLPASYTPSITRQHPVPTLGYCSRAKVACSSKAPKVGLADTTGEMRALAGQALEELMRVSQITQQTLKFHRQGGVRKVIRLSESFEALLELF